MDATTFAGPSAWSCTTVVNRSTESQPRQRCLNSAYSQRSILWHPHRDQLTLPSASTGNIESIDQVCMIKMTYTGAVSGRCTDTISMTEPQGARSWSFSGILSAQHSVRVTQGRANTLMLTVLRGLHGRREGLTDVADVAYKATSP